MYLDFISDIAKIGSRVCIECASGTFIGTIVRMSSEMIAVKEDDGPIIVKADSDITGLQVLEQSSPVSEDVRGSIEAIAPITTDNNFDPDIIKCEGSNTQAVKTINQQCLDLLDSIYNKSGVDLDTTTISNGSITSPRDNMSKDKIPILLDTGEIVEVNKWCMAGYNKNTGIEGARVYVKKAPYSSTIEMTYNELRDVFIKSIVNNRQFILNCVQQTLRDTPIFADCKIELGQLKTFIGQLKEDCTSKKEEKQLSEFVKNIISEENKNEPLSDAKIRSAFYQLSGKKYKVKAIREIREQLGIPDKSQRRIMQATLSQTSNSEIIIANCEIIKYFASFHNGAASNNEFSEIRFLDDVVEPSLLSELQQFHKGSTPIPAIATVSRIGNYCYASFLVKPSSVDKLREYSDNFKLASKSDAANALDEFIKSLNCETSERNITEDSLPDLLADARRQRLIHNYDASESAYIKLIEQNFSLDAVIKELASMYQETGNINKAIDLMEQNFGKMDDKQKAYNFISTIYTANSDYDKALSSLQNSSNFCDNNLQKSKILYNMALLYTKKGENDKAIKALKDAVSLNPNNKAATKLLRVREFSGVEKLEKKVDKIFNFKPNELIEYDIVNNDTNNSLVLSEETTEYLLSLKQIRNSGNDNSDEYRRTAIEYAKHKGTDLIKSGNVNSGRDFLIAAILQNLDGTDSSELFYLLSFYQAQLEKNQVELKDINSLFDAVKPLDDDSLFYGLLLLLSITNSSKKIIRLLYQSESWKPWILERLGVPSASPQTYIDIIQKKAQIEYDFREQYISSLVKLLQENDIEEIYKVLSQLVPPPLISKTDVSFSNEARDLAERIMQLRTASTYDNANDISIAIDRKINDAKAKISQNPTQIGCCVVLPLLLKISDICSKNMSLFVDSKAPIVRISSLCDASIISPNTCRIQIQVENQEGRMKILSGTVYVVSENSTTFEHNQFVEILKDTLPGGGTQQFQFDIPVSDEDIAKGELDPLKIGFRYEKYDFSSENKLQTLHIGISHPESFTTIPNPYSEFAHANTVEEDSMFKGREKTIQEICDNIVNGKKCYAIYGQKRSGKSSVLFHIAKKLRLEHRALAVNFSIGENVLGDRDNDDVVLYNLYYLILKEIENGLKRTSRSVYRETFGHGVTWEDIKDNPEAQFRDRLDYIVDILHERYDFQSPKIVLLIDEYTYIYSFIKRGLITPDFIKKMKALIENNYFTVVVAGHDAMPDFLNEFKNEFGIFEPYKLNYIDETSARELIEDPIRNTDGSSRYKPDAVNRILELTACSPFYIQIFCDEIVRYVNQNRKSQITIIDVNSVLNRLITNQGSISFGDFDNLISSGDGKLDPERVKKTYDILQEIAARTRKLEYCRKLDINVFGPQTDKLIIDDLIKRDVVIDNKNYTGDKQIKIKVELFKEWINNNVN